MHVTDFNNDPANMINIVDLHAGREYDQRDVDDNSVIDLADEQDEHSVYYVEKLLKYRYNDIINGFEYFCQWLDCPPAFCSWEEECNILDKDLISEFWQEEHRKQIQIQKAQIKLSQLMDGISRIHDVLSDENVLEKIEQILKEMPIKPCKKRSQQVNR